MGACLAVHRLTEGGDDDADHADRRCYAMKKVRPRELSDGMLAEMQNEIDMLKRVRHPNIVRMYETW